MTPHTLPRQRLAETSKAQESTAHEVQTIPSWTRSVWIAKATELGSVGIHLVPTSPDPMIADLIGVSLALVPDRAGYVPIGHRASNDLLRRSGSWPDRSRGGGLLAGQIPEHEALTLCNRFWRTPRP